MQTYYSWAVRCTISGLRSRSGPSGAARSARPSSLPPMTAAFRLVWRRRRHPKTLSDGLVCLVRVRADKPVGHYVQLAYWHQPWTWGDHRQPAYAAQHVLCVVAQAQVDDNAQVMKPTFPRSAAWERRNPVRVLPI